VQRAYCVALRIPRNRKDRRTDPKYETGSFGSTGCHSNNLLSDEGRRRNRIQKGDRLVFVQGNKIVFITPPIRQINKTQGYNVAVWSPSWASKVGRPLKLKYSMPLELDHARMINSKIRDLKKVTSHLRAYSQPLKKPQKLVNDFEAFAKKQKDEFGDKIYVERYCQTFCEDERCAGCAWLMEAKRRNGACHFPRWL
jgi:hypothetical protein